MCVHVSLVLRVCNFVCVCCESERERERERVCVCVCEFKDGLCVSNIAETGHYASLASL